MKKNYLKVATWSCALAAVSLIGSTEAAIVFADDFSDPNGTVLDGKAPGVGLGTWSEAGSSLTINNGVYDSSNDGYQSYGLFTSALGAGETLTMTYSTVAPSSGDFMSGSGWAGISLYTGGTERFFTGEQWLTGQWAAGGSLSSDSTVATTAVFTYEYDTGDWTFTTASGVNLSGVSASNLALDGLRIGNGDGAGGSDIAVDKLSIDISAVPEPSSSMLLGMAGLALVLKRRR